MAYEDREQQYGASEEVREQAGAKAEISDIQETSQQHQSSGSMGQSSGSIGKVKEQDEDCSNHFSSSTLFATSRSKENVNESSKTSAMDLEYGAVDALEVARLVAQEVERQVGDYEEDSGSSSSEGSSRDKPQLSDSPESSQNDTNQCAAYITPSNVLPTLEDVPLKEFQKKEEGKESGSTNLENIAHDIESSQITEAAQEPERTAPKEMCIDLNLEVCSEEDDDVANSSSNPVAVVSASRALAAPGLPSSPLKFEGALGWKGSAATSAFRTISAGGTSSGQKHDVFIDLNVAEDGDDVATDLPSGKQKLLPPGLPSGESSVELSPRRSAKRTFDLNQLCEEDVDIITPSLDWKMGNHPLGPQLSCRRSPSPASSSSSWKKPCLRNFDSNNGPSNYKDPVAEKPLLFLGQSSSSFSSLNKVNNFFGGSSDESVISIMGAKVKKDTAVYPTRYSSSNGMVSEPTVINPTSTNMPRAGTFLSGVGASPIPYAPSHMFSYNGFTMAPAMPFSSGINGSGMHGPSIGSGAYIVDSRGISLVPQLVGPLASTPYRGSYPQPSYVPNMMMGSMHDNPHGAGPSQPSLELNSGFLVDGSGREQQQGGGYRQFFIPNQSRLVHEEHQLRDGLQAPLPLFHGGVVGGKRKEPEGGGGGWGDSSYLASYRHHPPPPPL